MKHKSPSLLTAVSVVAVTAAPAFAEGSPWLPAPGAGTITVSYVSQEATEFYRAARKGPTPAGGHELGQQTLWFARTYGLSDSLALDFRVGGAESSGLDIGVAPFSPARFPELQEDIELFIGTIGIGLTDTTNLGISYGSVVGGRSTPVSDVIGVSLSFNFDTY